uniref:Uncharacterized protein n=1 Tax=Bionectria ochroleuca TaxID=29856 RepID=A0A8H7NJA8_BIOOC
MQKWKTDCPEYEAHMAAGCTKASTHKYLDKEEVETIIGRSRARGRTGMDNWMEMWRRLFPEDEKLVSPFLDTYSVEMTNACRDRNRLKIEEKLKSWIAAGGEPTPEEMREMVTEIQDLCLNTAPVEARPSRVPNHVYAKSTGSLSIQVQESRPRNHSDPGPSSLAVPCENHAPATAPLMYSQGSNEQYLSVPPREYRPSRNSMSALPFHTQPMATQEQPFLGPRSSSFSGGFTTTDSMFSATQNDVFNAANGLQYSEAADSSLLLEAYPTMASPWGIEDGLGAAQGLDSVAGRVQLTSSRRICKTYHRTLAPKAFWEQTRG